MINFSAREFAYVSVWSLTMSAGELTQLLGAEPDRGWSVGDGFLLRGQPRVRNATSWDLGPTIDPTSLIDDQLESLFARAEPILTRLIPRPANIGLGLVIVQNLSTDVEESHGLTLDEPWINLLGRCGGRIIVDQYVG